MDVKIANQKRFDERELMDPEIKQRWVEALRSGKYSQGSNYLCKDNKYCCLGVLAEINNMNPTERIKGGYDQCLPNDAFKGVGLVGIFKGFTIEGCNSLANLNDTGNYFGFIANVIEKYF